MAYYTDDGTPDTAFDLAIAAAGNCFDITWSSGTQIISQGIGIPAEGGIALAYMPPR